MVLARGGAIGVEQLSTTIGAATATGGTAALGVPHSNGTPSTDPDPPKLRRVERREQLIAALQAHRGNISAVARALGKARSQVQRWLHDYDLDPEQYRDR
jgi:transcriptional regulator of acetoin/glycerol metabolism